MTETGSTSDGGRRTHVARWFDVVTGQHWGEPAVLGTLALGAVAWNVLFVGLVRGAMLGGGRS